MRRWTQSTLVRDYVNDYLNLVYRYYAKHHIAFNCMYYSFNRGASVIDDDTLSSGYYNLNDARYHGCRWDLVRDFPLYFSTTNLPVSFVSDDRGFTKSDQSFEVVFPILFGIYPHTFDFIYIQSDAIDSPFYFHSLYRVTNFVRSNNRFFDFWKLTLYVSDFSRVDLDNLIQDDYVFDLGLKYIYLKSDYDRMVKLLSVINFRNIFQKFYYSPLSMYKID